MRYSIGNYMPTKMKDILSDKMPNRIKWTLDHKMLKEIIYLVKWIVQ